MELLKKVEAQYLSKGDYIATGIVTHAPYADTKTPPRKINLGVNGYLKTWNKKTIIGVYENPKENDQ